MNQSRLWPITQLLLLWIAFAASVWLTVPQLPERVATHFGAGGEPDGWMTRAGHVRFMLISGFAVPALVLGLFAFVGRCQGWGLNIPHKDYWLAPERREQTMAFLQRQGFWLAGLLIVFFAGINYSIVAANAQKPVGLPMALFGGIVGGFLLAIAAWSSVLLRRFFHRSA